MKSEYNHRKVVEKYSKAVNEIGLWKSEKIVFSKYIKKSDRILDIGCGAGRTTFALYDLGYRDIIGVDLSDEMVSACNAIKNKQDAKIPFIVADATKLPFDDDLFDTCIFSFNGLMTIPKYENRLAAMKDICRVLKTGGKFIFTTHDINNPDFLEYWKQEKDKWKRGIQDERLYEYGDLIFSKPDEYGDAISFVHVPLISEIERCLDESGFELINCINRSKICDEKNEVIEFSTDCKFWITEKK